MNKVHLLDKPAILSELKRLIAKSLPVKGTYVKTLDQDDIFDQPVNKTSQLEALKVGGKQIFVPIVKEPEMAEGAIPDDMMKRVISKIKDPKSRKILSNYLEQEKNQEVKVSAKTMQKMEDKEGGEDEEHKEILEKKKDYVNQLKQITSDAEIQALKNDDDFKEFKDQLKEAGLKFILAGLTRTFNAVEKRVKLNEAVVQAKANIAQQTAQAKVGQGAAAAAAAYAKTQVELFNRLGQAKKFKNTQAVTDFLTRNGWDAIYSQLSAGEKQQMSKLKTKFIKDNKINP